MAAESVRISLSGNQLRIEPRPKSTLLTAVHRVFFTNVLDFDLNEDGSGYTASSSESPTRTLLEAVRYIEQLGAKAVLSESASQLVSSVVRAESLLEAARVTGIRLKAKPAKAVKVPGLKRPLKPYQVPAVAHLVEVAHAANFSVPGSGKTGIVLAAFAILKAQGSVDKLMVIGPRASFMPWEEELQLCFDDELDALRIGGSKTARKKLYRSLDTHDLILLTYQIASNDASDLVSVLRRYKVMLVLDESHNIKRLEGGKWADSLIDLAPHATKRVILSGTPMPNSILDVWSQIEFLWPANSPLGDRDQFRYQSESQSDVALEQLRERLNPLYWRIRKRDLGLPSPTFRRIPVPMSKYQSAVYNALAARVLAEVVAAPEDRARLRVWRRARMIRLLQAASNPALLSKFSDEFKIPPLDASGLPVDRIIERYSDFEMPRKLAMAVELVRKLTAEGKKVLVWTAFVHNITTLRGMLADVAPAVIYGDVPRDETEDASFNREGIIHAFKTTDEYRVLIANPSACAESVSLHAACHDAVYVDRTFNAAHYMQSLDRIHRVGLEKGTKTRYYILKSEESIDEVIDQRLEDKIERMRRVLSEDLGVINLDLAVEDFSEEEEEAADFDALISALRARVA